MLSLCPGYYQQCCDEHWGTCVSFNSGFLGVYAQQWDCGGRSAERERQWNFPQQSRGVPRRGEPAVHQPSPSASERQSDATGVPSEQFRFIAKLLVYIGKQGGSAKDIP